MNLNTISIIQNKSVFNLKYFYSSTSLLFFTELATVSSAVIKLEFILFSFFLLTPLF